MASDIGRLRALSEQYQKLHETLQSHLQAGAKLAAQQTENDVVLEELKSLESDAVVYKTLGPLLNREERESAIETVEKRLNYIKGEQERLATASKQTQSSIDALARDIQSLQTALQAAHQRS